ncbi:MAG TPA: FCD domain-containing protein [Bacillota bacterium]|jgi:DNA-binding GntR family transcriptional regulator
MKLGVQDVADVLEVREVLEGLAASKAASQATQEDIAELRRLIGLMEKAVKNADYYEYNSFNRCFHEAIITASRNAKVIDALATIRAQLVQVHVRGLLMPGRAQHSLEEHQRLLAAIQKHDPAAAEAAARAHVQNHMQATLSALQRGVAI